MAKPLESVSDRPADAQAQLSKSDVYRAQGQETTPDSSAAFLRATHCLALSVRVVQQFVGRVPGGYRVDLYYSGERASGRAKAPLTVPNESTFESALRADLSQGCILTGNDWVTINSETAFDFDSRITLALSPDGKVDYPIAGRLRGRAQIRDAMRKNGTRYFDPKEGASEVFAVWQNGFGEDDYLPLLLSASFDVPMTGFGDAQDNLYKRARALASSLFIGRGKAFYRRGPYGDVKTIELDLFAIEPAI